MKNNLQNLHSPCMNCFQKGILYHPENETCSKCEYNVCVQLMKQILYDNDNCSLCKNRKRLGGGYWDCIKDKQDECKGKFYEIDWEEVYKEYNGGEA